MIKLHNLVESLNNKYLVESISLEDAIKDEIDHKRSLGYSDEELSQAEILENILYDDSYDLAEDERAWLEDICGSSFMDKNKKIAIADLFRSIGEWDIPFDLSESYLKEDINKQTIQDKIEDALSEIASRELYDNIVMTISSMVPEYNPDWFGNSDGFDTTYEKLDNAELEAQDKYVKAIANRLMAAYEGE
ncbi:MAG: hypothetical protein IJH55_02905 [Romboutsia sp.]|nr:hypothetical protein [Romboutsia sp.]